MVEQPLSTHARAPHPGIESLRVQVERTADGWLTCRYLVGGDIDSLLVPTRTPPRQADGLWHSTCCELFLRRPGTRAYLEVNASPSSEWAVYTFADYRSDRRALTPPVPPEIQCLRCRERWEVTVTIRLDALGVFAHDPLDAAISAVLQHSNGSLSYWALRHPEAHPDFHHPDSFVLELPAAEHTA